MPRCGHDDGAAVLGRVPDDRDDHRGDEEVGQMRLLRERLERVDEDLRDKGGHDRRGGEHEQRDWQATRPSKVLRLVDDVQLGGGAGACTSVTAT